jgi:hypothetical protein
LMGAGRQRGARKIRQGRATTTRVRAGSGKKYKSATRLLSSRKPEITRRARRPASAPRGALRHKKRWPRPRADRGRRGRTPPGSSRARPWSAAVSSRARVRAGRCAAWW